MGFLDRFKRNKETKKSYEEGWRPIGGTSFFNLSYTETAKLENDIMAVAKYNPYLAGAIRAIAENVTRPAFRVWNGKDVLTGTKIEKLVKNPNYNMDYTAFIRSMAVSYLIDGNIFIQVVTVAGIPSLFVLPPDHVVVERKGNQVSYYFRPNLNAMDKQALDPSTIYHVKDTTFDPFSVRGMSRLQHLIYSIVLSFDSDRFNYALFKNGGTPSGIITYDGSKEEAIADIKANFESNYQGVRNAGKTLVTTKGTTYTPTGMSIKDSSFDTLKNLSMKEILALYRVPPILLGDPTGTNYASSKTERKLFIEVTVNPLLDTIANVLTTLSNDLYKQPLEVYFDYSVLPEMQDDLNAKIQSAGLAVTYLGISPADAITAFDLPFSIDDTASDTAGKAIQTLTPDTSIDVVKGLDMDARFHISDKYCGLHDKLEKKHINAFEKYGIGIRNDLYDFIKETFSQKADKADAAMLIATFLSEHRAEYDKKLKALGLNYFDDILNGVVKDMIDEYHVQYAISAADEMLNTANHVNHIVGLNDTIYNEILQSVSDNLASMGDQSSLMDTLTNSVKGAISNYQARVPVITRTESNSYANTMIMTNNRANGITKKQWITARDGRVRDMHALLDGQIIDNDMAFSNGLRYPSDPASNDPSQVCNCRCVIAPVVEQGGAND